MESQSRLERCREIMKASFPKVKVVESLDFIAKFKKNPRCLTCSRYFPQSNISDVKAKIRGVPIEINQTLLFRLYKNSAEKLEGSKGYCCYSVGNINHAKTMIHVPEMSLCSDWVIHPEIREYIIALNQFLVEKERTKKEMIAEREGDFRRKEKAEKFIRDIDEKYKKGPGRPSNDPLNKNYKPKES